jgi:hypothetical protein
MFLMPIKPTQATSQYRDHEQPRPKTPALFPAFK